MLRIGRILTLMLSVSIAVVATTRAQSPDRNLEWAPIHEGGGRWVVHPGAFEIWQGAGELSDSGFVLSTTTKIYMGCFVTTPWMPIPQRSQVQLFPGIQLSWMGQRHRTDALDIGLTSFYLEIEHLDGRIEYKTFDVNVRNIKRDIFAYPDPNHVVYSVFIDTALGSPGAMMYSLDTAEPVVLRVRVCNLSENIRLQVRNLSLQHTPLN